GDRKPQHQSDPEPNGAHFRSDVSDGALPLSFWRRGSPWVLLCPGCRHLNRYLFFDCGGGAHAGGVSGLALGENGCSGGAGSGTSQQQDSRLDHHSPEFSGHTERRATSPGISMGAKSAPAVSIVGLLPRTGDGYV